MWDWESAVGIATRYGLKGPEFEPFGGKRSSLYHFRQALGPTELLYNGYQGPFRGSSEIVALTNPV